MTKSLTSTFAAALIASAAFGSAALASSGDYYQGSSAQPAASVDLFQTSSVRERSIHDGTTFQIAGQTPDNGDYYEGANRPQ